MAKKQIIRLTTLVYKHYIFLMLERDRNYIVGFVQYINDRVCWGNILHDLTKKRIITY